MADITDEMIHEWLASAAGYCVVILRHGARYADEGSEAIVWEHGRRNMALQADGVLPIVCPVTDDSEVSGIGILAADPEEARRIMDDDPGVRAGVFTYELHPCRSLPGSKLPPR